MEESAVSPMVLTLRPRPLPEVLIGLPGDMSSFLKTLPEEALGGEGNEGTSGMVGVMARCCPTIAWS